MMNFNYWKLELYELPSYGMFYPEGTVIKCRPLSILDVKFLSTINPYTATGVINEILERCIYLEQIKFSDILLCDRQYILFWLRANSFIKNNGYTFSISKCNQCGMKFEETIKLDSFDVIHVKNYPAYNVKLPDSEEVITLRYPSIRQLSIRNKDADTELIARYLDIPNPIQFLNECSAYDYAFLLSSVKDFYAGFQETLFVKCPHCGKEHQVKIVINDENMFGTIKLYDIIKSVISITKYTTMQISDDVPWMELELQQDIVNKMVKEENEEMAKQEAKAKARAHVPSSVSKYRH